MDDELSMGSADSALCVTGGHSVSHLSSGVQLFPDAEAWDFQCNSSLLTGDGPDVPKSWEDVTLFQGSFQRSEQIRAGLLPSSMNVDISNRHWQEVVKVEALVSDREKYKIWKQKDICSIKFPILFPQKC